MEDNKITTMYKCAICGKTHESIEQRAKCEMTCLEKMKEAEAKAAAEKKAKEQAIRKQEVDDAFDFAYKLKKKYIEDYGHYTTVREIEDNDVFRIFRMLP